MTVSEPQRRRAWGLAAGRCVICNKDLLEGGITGREISLGELAHIVGQKDTEKSPRGKAASLTQSERDSADNVMLLCADDHDEIDDPAVIDIATIEWLHEKRRAHHARVKLATSFGPDQRSVVLRMIGNVRGKVVEIYQDTASTTVLHSGQRLPDFPLAFDRHSIEIDLRDIPGEAAGGGDYYQAAIAAIDDVIDGRLREGVLRDAVPNLSVFAFARVPLLVYLGSRLDDTIPTAIYQRHRSTEDWQWHQAPGSETTFTVSTANNYPSDEAVLLVSVSGTTHRHELPEHVTSLPIYEITVDGDTPSPDIIASPEVLKRFENAVRAVLANLEATNKSVRRLHVFGAIPLAGAVALGRTADPNVHPSLVLYDRVGHTYEFALETRT